MDASRQPKPRERESRAPAAFAEDIDSYLAFLALERGLSPHTRAGYGVDLDQCASHLQRVGVSDWSAVSGDQVETWIHSLGDEDYTVASLARKLAALRGFARHLIAERRRTDDFMELVSGPKLVRRVPGCLSEREVGQLLASPAGEDPYSVRDRAILELFYSSGLRVSEMLSLRIQQLDTESGFVLVHGKGNKERVVPVGSKALAAIQSWLVRARPQFVKPKTGSHLFISERGGPLSRISLWFIVRKHAKAAGIRRPVKPHLLRHSFASHLLANGADLRSIQEMLGHVNVSTTQIYTAVDQGRLAGEHERFHPRGREAGA